MEPETGAVNGNGANGNGHHDAIGPTVELVRGQRALRQRERPCARPGQRQRGQRPPRRCRGAAAVAVLLGGVHGRGAAEAEGPQEQAKAGFRLPIRVGAGVGTGTGDGRRGTLGCKSQGETAHWRWSPPARRCMRPFLRFNEREDDCENRHDAEIENTDQWEV